MNHAAIITAVPGARTVLLKLDRDAGEAGIIDAIGRSLRGGWDDDRGEVLLHTDRLILDAGDNRFLNGPDAVILPRLLQGDAALGGCTGEHPGPCNHHCLSRDVHWHATLDRHATACLMLLHPEDLLLDFDVGEEE